jgi:hypothetical protein
VTRFGSCSTLLCTFLTLALGPQSGVNAQSNSELPNGPALGATVDRFSYEGEGITALTFRFSGLRSRTLGSEIGVSLFPDGLQYGTLLLAPDLGAAFNASGPGITVLVKGGLSMLAGIGRGLGFIPGYHLGGGLIVKAGKRMGIRLDLARHVYLAGDATSEPVWSVGIGFTSLAQSRVTWYVPPSE